MKVLVIGHGGREHAFVRALSQSPSVTEIHVIPGNPGMNRQALCHDIKVDDYESITQFCLRTEIDFVLIGPELPLAKGMADFLRNRGILVVGPNQDAAMLESSKVFSKEFIEAAGIPTPRACVVRSVEDCLDQMKKFKAPFVLKADGLADGKGVFICDHEPDLLQKASLLFRDKILGTAADQALLEEYVEGYELSIIVLTNGVDFQILPLAQDHKRLKDGDQGPNTAGMGAIAPATIDPKLMDEIRERIVKPTIAELQKRALVFRGFLFIGVMVTATGVMVLEYNVRFGDPEAHVVLPLLDADWGLTLNSLAQGKITPLKFKNLHSCCVYLAAEGYPKNPVHGAVINGDVNFESPSSYFIHAATRRNEAGELVTHGGRILAAVGLGSTLDEAVNQAYDLVKRVSWTGMQYRSDIGKSLPLPTNAK